MKEHHFNNFKTIAGITFLIVLLLMCASLLENENRLQTFIKVQGPCKNLKNKKIDRINESIYHKTIF